MMSKLFRIIVFTVEVKEREGEREEKENGKREKRVWLTLPLL